MFQTFVALSRMFHRSGKCSVVLILYSSYIEQNTLRTHAIDNVEYNIRHV